VSGSIGRAFAQRRASAFRNRREFRTSLGMFERDVGDLGPV
jgi:hypothetical protein